MPEGDSVFRAAAQLHAALAGKELVSSDFRVPRFATLRLGGWTVDEVVPRGKHLLMRVHGPTPKDRLTIHSHLKMEGSWQVYPAGGRWRKPGFTARCVLRTATADAVGFSLGILEVVRTDQEDAIVGHLGPDLLGRDWDPAEAERRLLAAPDVPIGVALLDQSKLAGIGNIYRCEACFLAGVHPASPVSAVPDLAALIADAQVLLSANLGPGRRTTVLNAARRARGPHRRPPRLLGLPARAPAVPEVRHSDPARSPRQGQRRGYLHRGTGHLLLPECQPLPGPLPQ